ncbi:MAG: outer membrane lipoprotein-sorting protein [Endomicrobium sp.]|nr:outer membrane lipoprotein-sorting protein [Endomicrobium sp.]
MKKYILTLLCLIFTLPAANAASAPDPMVLRGREIMKNVLIKWRPFVKGVKDISISAAQEISLDGEKIEIKRETSLSGEKFRYSSYARSDKIILETHMIYDGIYFYVVSDTVENSKKKASYFQAETFLNEAMRKYVKAGWAEENVYAVIGAVRRNSDFVFMGSQKVAARDCYIVKAVSHDKKTDKGAFYIDKQNNLLIKYESFSGQKFSVTLTKQQRLRTIIQPVEIIIEIGSAIKNKIVYSTQVSGEFPQKTFDASALGISKDDIKTTEEIKRYYPQMRAYHVKMAEFKKNFAI